MAASVLVFIPIIIYTEQVDTDTSISSIEKSITNVITGLINSIIIVILE